MANYTLSWTVKDAEATCDLCGEEHMQTLPWLAVSDQVGSKLQNVCASCAVDLEAAIEARLEVLAKEMHRLKAIRDRQTYTLPASEELRAGMLDAALENDLA